MPVQRYDLKKIGKRIRFERRSLGFSRAEVFGEALHIGRTQVEQIEQGKRLPDLDTLVKMAELFDCEIGYLLCEYDSKTRAATDICNKTGLSAEAVYQLEKLQTLNSPFTDFVQKFLSTQIIDESFLTELFRVAIANEEIVSTDEGRVFQIGKILMDRSDAVGFLQFAMQQEILKFTKDFFKEYGIHL